MPMDVSLVQPSVIHFPNLMNNVFVDYQTAQGDSGGSLAGLLVQLAVALEYVGNVLFVLMAKVENLAIMTAMDQISQMKKERHVLFMLTATNGLFQNGVK
jgi:hypothetical protein